MFISNHSIHLRKIGSWLLMLVLLYDGYFSKTNMSKCFYNLVYFTEIAIISRKKRIEIEIYL